MPREHRVGGPEPPYPPWMVDNPITRLHAGAVLNKLDVQPGMRALDFGAGPGRLTLPLARRVAPSGEVVAVDIAPKMIELLEARKAGVTNIRTVLGGAGMGADIGSGFDLAVLSAVLGEIPPAHRQAAIVEIYDALKARGILAVIEARPDPDFQKPRAVAALADGAGFELKDYRRLWTGFLSQFVKPDRPA